MPPLTTPPKVFVSYCWTNEVHQNEILECAKRLVADGVDVELDLWSLREGQDKYAFMEKMVSDPSVSKVLIFSDAEYARKADAREGGVGTESQIISKEVYDKVDQQKFIPLACEFSGNEPCLPVFLKNRKWIDFSSPEKANENYEQLLRAIFNRPLHAKPAIGAPPKHLFAQSIAIASSRPYLAHFKNALIADRSNYRGLALQFLEDFFRRMQEFRLPSAPGATAEDLVFERIDQFVPFRDDFIEFVSLACSIKDDPQLYEDIAEFFEKTLALRYPLAYDMPWIDSAFDHFRFTVYELFLYTIALIVKYRRFTRASIFFDKRYFLPENAHTGKSPYRSFDIFLTRCESLQRRNERLQQHTLSPEADLLKSRATSTDISFEQLTQADCICFLGSLLAADGDHVWFPNTALFKVHGTALDLFARAAFHKDFLSVAMLFNVNSRDDLIAKIAAAEDRVAKKNFGFKPSRQLNVKALFNLAHLDSVE